MLVHHTLLVRPTAAVMWRPALAIVTLSLSGQSDKICPSRGQCEANKRTC